MMTLPKILFFYPKARIIDYKDKFNLTDLSGTILKKKPGCFAHHNLLWNLLFINNLDNERLEREGNAYCTGETSLSKNGTSMSITVKNYF